MRFLLVRKIGWIFGVLSSIMAFASWKLVKYGYFTKTISPWWRVVSIGVCLAFFGLHLLYQFAREDAYRELKRKGA